MAESTTNEREKVIGEVPKELRAKIDTLGDRLDLKMSQMLREAIERTIPVWEERAAEREAATAGVGV